MTFLGNKTNNTINIWILLCCLVAGVIGIGQGCEGDGGGDPSMAGDGDFIDGLKSDMDNAKAELDIKMDGIVTKTNILRNHLSGFMADQNSFEVIFDKECLPFYLVGKTRCQDGTTADKLQELLFDNCPRSPVNAPASFIQTGEVSITYPSSNFKSTCRVVNNGDIAYYIRDTVDTFAEPRPDGTKRIENLVSANYSVVTKGDLETATVVQYEELVNTQTFHREDADANVIEPPFVNEATTAKDEPLRFQLSFGGNNEFKIVGGIRIHSGNREPRAHGEFELNDFEYQLEHKDLVWIEKSICPFPVSGSLFLIDETRFLDLDDFKAEARFNGDTSAENCGKATIHISVNGVEESSDHQFFMQKNDSRPPPP